MTTLTSKFQETTKRLQQLTVWKPTERDPFVELDHWRTNAHRTIEQIYNRKREQIEQLVEKHEREFMRQIVRQRTLSASVRKRLLSHKDLNQSSQLGNQTSILSDLQKIENDINTKLGRAEILIEIQPLNIEHTVSVSLRTYLTSIPSMYAREYSTKNQPKKPEHRSTAQIKQAYEKWSEGKQEEARIINESRSRSAKIRRDKDQEDRQRRYIASREAVQNWTEQKKRQGAFTKKRTSVNTEETID